MENKKRPTAKQIIDALDKWQGDLADSKKVSNTKFQHMQLAIYGAKCIVRDAFGISRVKENSAR